jgi:hypothetical protein
MTKNYGNSARKEREGSGAGDIYIYIGVLYASAK